MIYTVGHSKLDPQPFLELVKGLDLIVDVRSHPTSRWPHFHSTEFQALLATAGIDYLWEPGLGGWSELYPQHRDFAIANGVNFDAYCRGKFPKQIISRTLIGSDKPQWTNQGLLDYAWWMATPEYLDAFKRLRELGKSRTVGITCCEVLYWKCHRSMVADHLVYCGDDATHLQPRRQAHSTIGTIGHRLLRYPEEVKRTW